MRKPLGAWGLAVLLTLFGLAPAWSAPMPARWKAQAARVEIRRDDWGVAHIHGKTDADAVFGMIYAQAEDDFNRVEANYLTYLGWRAEAEGEALIWQDLRQKLYIDPVVLKADYAKSPAWLKTLMTAWADGLNYYLATHPQTKPRVITRFEPWMALSFTEGSIGGDVESNVSLSQLEAVYGKRQVAMTSDERGLVFKEPQGSNGFAIAPQNTTGGHALLLINPHTSFFFRSELQATSDEGLNAYGAVTWGQFFIYQGFNSKIGWMHTSSGADVVDEFAETITDQGGKLFYRYGSELRPVTVKPITVRFKKPDGTLGTRTFTTYATHHGPVVKAAGGKWIALALMNTPIPALEQSWLRTKASDYASFMQAAELKANSSNNTLFASSKGEIAYLHPQFVPRRDDRFDYGKPVDGSDPATDWKGLHALSELPQAVNPPNGWAFNVNDWPYSAAGPYSPKKEAFPRYMDRAGPNPRSAHATLVLTGRKDFTLPGLVTAAYDPFLPAFSWLIPGLVQSYDMLGAADPVRVKLADQIAALRRWDYKWSAASPETSLAVFWGEALYGRVIAAARAAGASPYDYMAAAPAADKLKALAEASDRLTADFGGWKTPWGEINRYQRNDGAIVQTFKDDKPSIPVPFASSQWGSLASFGARRYEGTKRYYGTSGNSFVAAVEFGERVKAVAVSAGGESGDPASPHFGDQALRYSQGALRPVYFYPDELKGHVEKTYHPGG